MKTFTDNQRVRVNEMGHLLNGKTGTVVRLRRGDNAAWVRMDEDVPVEIRLFPSSDTRANDVLFYPSECSPAKE